MDWLPVSVMISSIVRFLVNILAGNNTLFEVKTKSNMAVKYHNSSVMEKMHVSKTIDLLERDFKNNPYSDLNKDGKTRAKRIITRCILATDMVSFVFILF